MRHTLGMSTQFLKINPRDVLSQLAVRGKRIFLQPRYTRGTRRCTVRALACFVGMGLIVCCAYAQTLQEKLIQRAALGTTCKEIPNNGRSCTYKFGEFLEIGIKDIGGTDTVIGFHHSDMREELYAVMYFGCIAVVPGGAHPRNYDRNYGVFISPTTGRIYSTSAECRKTL